MAITINSETGNIFAGGDETDGDLILRSNGENRIHLDAGGNAPVADVAQTSVYIDGRRGNIFCGGVGREEVADGDLILRSNGETRIHLDAGGNAPVADVAQASVYLDGQNANLSMGGKRANGSDGPDGDIFLFARNGDRTNTSNATIHLSGDAGDIILRNADCAEDFEVEEEVDINPGTVMIIGENSKLRKCHQPYDKRVAGIIAGAGSYKPGIILGRKEGVRNAFPIALVGRVFCKVDATYGPINIGDLLTTSPSPGYAMNATDAQKAFGAVIGKALGVLESGRGLVPTLIALQ